MCFCLKTQWTMNDQSSPLCPFTHSSSNNGIIGLERKGLQNYLYSLYTRNEKIKLPVFLVIICALVNKTIRQELHLLWSVTSGLKETWLVLESDLKVSMLRAAVILYFEKSLMQDYLGEGSTSVIISVDIRYRLSDLLAHVICSRSGSDWGFLDWN